MADRRLTAARGDIAAKHLEGQVQADRFVEGEELEVIEPIAPLRQAPSHGASLETEALKGERVTVYDRDGEKCVTPGCSGTVKRIVQTGRSTFYCPVCQK